MPYTKDDVPYVTGSGTSAAAAHVTNATRDKGRVLDYIRRAGGATDDEVERAIGMAHQTASARRRDLVLAGLVTESGHYRQTCRGCTATVWISTKAGQHTMSNTNTKPNIKQTIDPKQCAAMRCKSTPTAWVSGIHWDFDVRMGVPLCDTHFTPDLRAGEEELTRLLQEEKTPREDLGAFIETHGESTPAPAAPAPTSTFDEAARSMVTATVHEADESIVLVQGIQIESQDDLNFVNELLVDVKRKLNQVLEVEARVTKPLSALLESTRDLFRPAKQKLSLLEAMLKGRVADAKAREDANNRAALARAAEAHAAGDTQAVDAALVQVRHQSNVEGVETRIGWTWEVEDLGRIPVEYFKLDETALNKLCKGSAEPKPVPGIRFVQKNIVVVRGAGVQPDA